MKTAKEIERDACSGRAAEMLGLTGEEFYRRIVEEQQAEILALEKENAALRWELESQKKSRRVYKVQGEIPRPPEFRDGERFDSAFIARIVVASAEAARRHGSVVAYGENSMPIKDAEQEAKFAQAVVGIIANGVGWLESAGFKEQDIYAQFSEYNEARNAKA